MNITKLVLGLALPVLSSTSAFAHCDTLDGPVVDTAKKALTKNDVNLVLVWVQKSGEVEIRDAFKRTMEVRKLGGEAQRLADTYFFETLVRIHRAGEGAPFTGLKPAGQDLGPAVPLGDQSVATGDLKSVERFLTETSTHKLHQTFSEVMETKNYKPSDVEAGRKHIAAYVTYIHYVEGLYAAANRAGHGEGEENHSAHSE